jgi:Phospholipase_D-nuclease N-terminal
MNAPELAILVLIVLPMLAIWLYVLVDAVRRDDLSATSKIVWILAALILPLVTVLLYLLTRPRRRSPAPAAGPPVET